MNACSVCIRKPVFSCLPSFTVQSTVAVLESPDPLSTPFTVICHRQTKQQHCNLLNVRLHRARGGGGEVDMFL